MEREQASDLIRAQLRLWRANASLTQEQFGKKVNFSGSMISAIELGQTPRAALPRPR